MKRSAIVVKCLAVCAVAATIGVFFKYGLNARTGTAILVSLFGLYVVVGVILDRVVYLGVGAFQPPYTIMGKVLAVSMGVAIVALALTSIVPG